MLTSPGRSGRRGAPPRGAAAAVRRCRGWRARARGVGHQPGPRAPAPPRGGAARSDRAAAGRGRGRRGGGHAGGRPAPAQSCAGRGPGCSRRGAPVARSALAPRRGAARSGRRRARRARSHRAAVAAGDLEGRRLVDCFTVVDPADGPGSRGRPRDAPRRLGRCRRRRAAAVLDPGSAREEVLAAGARPPVRAPLPRGRAGPCIDPTDRAPRPPWRTAWAVCGLSRTAGGARASPPRAVAPSSPTVPWSRAGVRGGGRPGRTLELAADERDAAAAADAALVAERQAEAARSAAGTELAAAQTARRRDSERAHEARLTAVEAGAALAAPPEALAGEQRRLEDARWSSPHERPSATLSPASTPRRRSDGGRHRRLEPAGRRRGARAPLHPRRCRATPPPRAGARARGGSGRRRGGRSIAAPRGRPDGRGAGRRAPGRGGAPGALRRTRRPRRVGPGLTRRAWCLRAATRRSPKLSSVSRDRPGPGPERTGDRRSGRGAQRGGGGAGASRR